MKLSPPSTILAIVTAAFGAMAAFKYDPDCRFTPDGKPRYSSSIAAFVSWFAHSAQCDVWSGIEATKPIETIELQESTPGGATILAQIDQHGTGFVAVIPPYDMNHPLREKADLTRADLSKYGTIYEIGGIDNKLYQAVKDLVGPMRDFQGGWFLEVSDSRMRKQVGLDDPRTRIIQCRKPESSMPAQHGPVIAFRSGDGKQTELVSLGVNCVDVAMQTAEIRNKEAVDLLIKATGQADGIRARGMLDYPICQYAEVSQPCITPRL